MRRLRIFGRLRHTPLAGVPCLPSPRLVVPERPRLLIAYLKPTAFVREDLRLLRLHYDVCPFAFGMHRGPRLIRRFAEQALWLRRHLPGAAGVLVWFADYHAALPVALARRAGVPVAAVLGGYDCARLPELGYGVFASRWRAPLARYVHQRATRLLPVTGSLIASENSYTRWPDRQRYGLRVHVSDLTTPVTPLPTGYDPAEWPLGPPERPRRVLTVGYVDDLRTARVKGLDIFIAAARHLPSVPFEVVGVDPAVEGALRKTLQPPPNVRLAPPLPRADLPAAYHRAAVYAQLSRTEGLPNVLCEAMLCGCVPVGSPVFGIPDAIGEAGFVVESPDPEAVAAAIAEALETEPARRPAIRSRIEARFPLAAREAGLLDVFDRMRRGA